MSEIFDIEELLVSNHTLPAFTNNTTDIEQLLVKNLGPRQKDFVSAILLTIVYSLIFISGMVGNICTCLVITRTHSMQTTTNYYLFSLAVSDLLLIFFGLPPELYSIWEAYPWRLGEAFCYLRQSVLESTSYASVLTITAFTFERYLAICHPLLAHKISALSRAVKIIISIWIISFLVALPYAIHTRVYYGVIIAGTNKPVPDSLVCNIPYHFLTGFMYYMFQVSTFLFFVGPVTIIIILYILIGVALRRSPLARGASDERCYSSMKTTSSCSLPQQPRKVVIRMLVAVTVAFIVCWAPFHAQRLMVLYVPHWTPHLLRVQSHIFYISGVLYFVSSTVNPILYNVISKRYRAAFKQIIFPCCYTKPAHSSMSQARHSERFSKSQAMVVLKNGNDGLRVVFRQEPGEKVSNYETIPLNGARRSAMMEEDDVGCVDVGVENSSVSGISAEVPSSPTRNRALISKEFAQRDVQPKPCLKTSRSNIDSEEVPGSRSSFRLHPDSEPCLKPCLKHDHRSEPGHHSRPSLKVRHDLENYVIKNPAAAEKDGNYLSQHKKTVAALKKAEKPRKSYAHQVNGRVPMTTGSTVCEYDANHTPVVR